MTDKPPAPTILGLKQHDAPSIFAPANLLREARRQRGLPDEPVPAVCALDPDGDVVRHLRDAGTAHKVAGWACYHTDMYVTEHAGIAIGIVGCAVGAPFAVLVAEQLFVSGCRFLVSITSAGQIAPKEPPPYFVLIDRAAFAGHDGRRVGAFGRWYKQLSLLSGQFADAPTSSPGPASAAQQNAQDSTDNMRENWARIRERLEAIATASNIDGRTRARYGRIDRRRIGDLVNALHNDERLGADTELYRKAIELWQRYRTGRATPSPNDVQTMRELAERLTRVRP
jgi:hypothetical protein